LDGGVSHHTRPGGAERGAQQIGEAIRALLADADGQRLRHLHGLVVQDGVLPVIDLVLA
jgi:hypothetical protein